MPKTQVLTQTIQYSTSGRHFEFWQVDLVLITQENHLITNLEMIQSCIVSMQVATCAMIVVYRQNKQAQITAE